MEDESVAQSMKGIANTTANQAEEAQAETDISQPPKAGRGENLTKEHMQALSLHTFLEAQRAMRSYEHRIRSLEQACIALAEVVWLHASAASQESGQSSNSQLAIFQADCEGAKRLLRDLGIERIDPQRGTAPDLEMFYVAGTQARQDIPHGRVAEVRRPAYLKRWPGNNRIAFVAKGQVVIATQPGDSQVNDPASMATDAQIIRSLGSEAD